MSVQIEDIRTTRTRVVTRPIVQMNFPQSFNEVFLTDAHVPHTGVVGAVGDGWRVARGTLAHERSFSTRNAVNLRSDAMGRVIDEAKEEVAEHLAVYKWYPQREGRIDLVIERARASGVVQDPVVRQQVMKLISCYRAADWTADRAKAAQDLGRPPGSDGSIGKLALSEIAHRCNDVHSLIAGARGLLRNRPDPTDVVIAEVLVSTIAQSIAGGTDEIQRNILGEILGLPKEPSVDKGIPFRKVARS